MGLFFRFIVVTESKPQILIMQLTIRGQESYMLDFNGDETFAQLKNRICEHEKMDDILLYVSGKPLSEDGVVSSIENCAVDVTVPLLGGKVHGYWLVLVKSVVSLPKLMPKRRRKREQDGLKDEFSTTGGLLTS